MDAAEFTPGSTLINDASDDESDGASYNASDGAGAGG
jgi:hypothetical protein